MKKEDREYFSGKLHTLADAFMKVVPRLEAGKNPQVEMGQQLSTLKSLKDEFDSKGYSSRQWNRLVTTSGVAAKMKPYGGAFKELTSTQVRKLEKKMAAYLKKRAGGPG